jgi:hypothetical protein
MANISILAGLLLLLSWVNAARQNSIALEFSHDA